MEHGLYHLIRTLTSTAFRALAVGVDETVFDQIRTVKAVLCWSRVAEIAVAPTVSFPFAAGRLGVLAGAEVVEAIVAALKEAILCLIIFKLVVAASWGALFGVLVGVEPGAAQHAAG